MTLYGVRSQEHAWILSFLSVEKPSLFLASDVIKRHFGAHTESQESSSLPVAKKVLGLCLAKRRLYFTKIILTTLCISWLMPGIPSLFLFCGPQPMCNNFHGLHQCLSTFKFNLFSATRCYKRHQNKVKVKSCGRNTLVHV